jgi:hypothetical protein
MYMNHPVVGSVLYPYIICPVRPVAVMLMFRGAVGPPKDKLFAKLTRP